MAEEMEIVTQFFSILLVPLFLSFFFQYNSEALFKMKSQEFKSRASSLASVCDGSYAEANHASNDQRFLIPHQLNADLACRNICNCSFQSSTHHLIQFEFSAFWCKVKH